MIIINKDSKLGEIVTSMPNASEIFNSYNLDYCCNGHNSIEESCKKANLDYRKIIKALESLKNEMSSLEREDDFSNMTTKDLIDYIINVHHKYLNQHLPIISKLSQNVLRAHRANHEELFKVHKLFHSLKTELEQHLIKEEINVFPLILTQTDSLLLIKEIESEHINAGEILRELKSVTQDYSVPQDGCSSYLNLYKELDKLEKDVFNHIHLENNILHKRIY